jgi:hypothetical protein
MSTREQNLLLGRLPSNERSKLSSALVPVRLAKNFPLFESRRANDFVYFPLDAVVSFAGDMGQGGTVEVWSVGREGIAGISSVFGAANPFRGVVAVPGAALKAPADTVVRCFKDSAPFQQAALSYFHYLLIQISYLGICNNSHPLVQRLSRWLLIMQERAGTKDLKFTQELIASMLGTRRATISVAAAALQSAGLISYTPGSITIKSRSGLKKMACGCHKMMNTNPQ